MLLSRFPIVKITNLFYTTNKLHKIRGKMMDEVIGEVVAGICEFVVEVTADAIGNLVSGKDEEKKHYNSL